jgi:hypothetical protein
LSITTLPAASGNPYINGLTTEPGQDTAVIFTPGSTIKYFFDTDARAWSEAEQSAVRMAWDSWNAVINLNIKETTQRDEATVLMQISVLPQGVVAVATAPKDGLIPSTNKITVAGDALKYLSAGGDSFLTFVHEIGHNLGLYHPHNTTVFPGVTEGGQGMLGDNNLNQSIWTVMSYNKGYHLEQVNSPAFGNAIGPMTLDIAAAQFAYGAKAANTGDNTYLLPTQNIVGTGWKAIWDTGGVDTLSAAGSSLDVTIDLREAPLVRTEATGYVSWVPGIKGGYSIANESVIENAIGGAGSDTLIGNDADNIFVGGGGDDSIMGGGGIDTVSIGTGVDTAGYSGNQSSYTLTLSPTATSITDRRVDGNGTDQLIDIEFLDFDTEAFPFDFNLIQFGGATGLSESQFKSFIELYIAYFNRAPDAVGLNYWGTAFANGTTHQEMATLFIDQDETRATYPTSLTNADFATAVYNNVLGRIPDQAGFDFWVGILESGARGRDQFILSVLKGVQDGSPDQAYLSNKIDIGAYFAVHKGMSDGDNASAAMALFDGTEASINNAVNAIDAFYANAIDADTGEFLMQVVGILDDPFTVA